jgi:hypothetical protein
LNNILGGKIMAQKGANTRVVEAKNKLTNTINECLKDGIPASMVSIIVESLLMDLNNNVKVLLDKEKQEYEEQEKVESEQVVYEESEQEPDLTEDVVEEE